MPEKSVQEKSVQVDAIAHAKVQGLAEVLGSTQRTAASLLIHVADERVAVDHHHEDVTKRLAARSSAGKAPSAGGVTGAPEVAQPVAGGRDQGTTRGLVK